MSRRRPSGDGMVRKREDGRWEGRIVVGHKENGDPIFRYIYADTQKELTVKLRQSIEAYQGVELTEESRITLGQWLEKWLKNMAPTLRPATLSRYEGTVRNHIVPYMGDKPISQITGKDIQKLYDTLARQGNRNTGEGLASGTIRGIHAMFHEAMGAAQQAGLIPRNPTEDIGAPKFSYKSKKVLTDEQLEKFMETIQRDSIWCDFFYTELTTGLRRGEICGLKWEDFDEIHGTLKIRRTIHEEKGGKLTPWDTKTAAGARTIQLSPSTAALLRERKKTALTEWIFPHPWKPEQPTRPSAAYERMKVLLKEAGLPDLRFHDLRHTFATHALTSGVDVKTLSGILGHTRAAFTLDTYTHTTGDMQKRAAEIVEEFLIDIFGEELKPWAESEKTAKAPSG